MKEKKNPYEGMGRILVDGKPIEEVGRETVELLVTDAFIRSAYRMRDSGELTERLNAMLHQWSYHSPVTGEVCGLPNK